MKKIIFSMMVAAAVSMLWAKNDPVAPYHQYGPAQKSTAEKQLTFDWQKKNRAEIDAATTDEALAAFVADDASARALLAKLKGAYATDPLTRTQVSSVSQWVMLPDPWYAPIFFWSSTHADGRVVWVKALLDTAENATDKYVKILCLDELRWCGCDCPCVVKRIRAIGEKGGDKDIRALADIVVRSITKK